MNMRVDDIECEIICMNVMTYFARCKFDDLGLTFMDLANTLKAIPEEMGVDFE